jgi:hypothetical protein
MGPSFWGCFSHFWHSTRSNKLQFIQSESEMILPPRNLGGADMFKTLVDSIGQSRAVEVLGVSKGVLTSWYKGRRVPYRCAFVALYWESPWGRSVIDSAHHAEVSNLHGLLKSLSRECDAMRMRVAFLQSGHHGCANSSFYDTTDQSAKALSASLPKQAGDQAFSTSGLRVDVIPGDGVTL